MDIKYGTLTKRIDGVLNILYAKTTSDMVIHDDTSVKNTLDSIASDLLTLSGQTSTIDSRISAACAELYNRIMGITDNDTISEAYDTLKEVSDYLTEHEDVVTGFINDIGDLQAEDTSIKNVLGTDQIIDNYSGEKLINRVGTAETDINNLKDKTDTQEKEINLIKNGYEYDYRFYSNCYTWNAGKYIKVIDNTLAFVDSDKSAYLKLNVKKNEHYIIKGALTLDIPLLIMVDTNGNIEYHGFSETNTPDNVVADYAVDDDGNLFAATSYIDNFEGELYINAPYATKACESLTINKTIEDTNEESHTIQITLPAIGTPVIGKAYDIKKSNTCFVTFIGDKYCYGENWCVSHYKPSKLGKNNLREEDLTYYGIDENNNKVELSENNYNFEVLGEAILNCIPGADEARCISANFGSDEWANNDQILKQYPGLSENGGCYGIPLAFAQSNRDAYVLTTYQYLAINIYDNEEENMLDYDLKYTMSKYCDNIKNLDNYYIIAFMMDEFINGSTLGDPDNMNWLPKEYNNIENIKDKYIWNGENTGNETTTPASNDYDSYLDRLQITITKLIHDIPGVKIGFITPLKLYNEDYTAITNKNNETLETWVNAAKKVCNYFNIPVLDLYHDGGHSSFQASYENCYTDSTFKDSNDNYVCYPNASTYRSINNKIENFIFSL